MTNLQVFNNPEFGDIRTTIIEGEPWFVGKDVAEALGYERTADAIKAHVEEEDREMLKVGQSPTLNVPNRGVTIINESGLYSLIISSKMPSARKFRRWITSEVLPSIRKQGGYIAEQEEMSSEELMARALEVARKVLADRETRIKTQEAQISTLAVDKQIMQPKAEYFDDLVDRNLLSNFTEVAKELGVKRKDFIGFLLDQGYIYRDKKGNLMPRANEKAKGLFEVKQCSNQKTAWAGCQTLLTPKGVETFRLLCQGI